MPALIVDKALYAQKLSFFQKAVEDVLEILQGKLGYNHFCKVFSGEMQVGLSCPCARFTGVNTIMLEGCLFPVGSFCPMGFVELAILHMWVTFSLHPSPHHFSQTYLMLSANRVMGRGYLLCRREQGSPPCLGWGHPCSLKVNDTISYACPIFNKMCECVVTDLSMSRVRGQWFEVVYLDDPNVKVVLNYKEMEEILGCCTMVT